MLHRPSLASENCLAEVIRQMVRAAQQDSEAIARSIFCEIFCRHGRVPLQPVRLRHFFKTPPQFTVYAAPCLAHLSMRRNAASRLVWMRDEGDIKLGMKSFTQPQQREHRVVYGCEMSPQ